MATQDGKEDLFTNKISQFVTNGFLTVGLGLGRELGLFTAMADIDKPATATEIATKAGCKERLVREWLHQMAVGGIIDIDETGDLFYLPAYRRAGLQSVHTGTACMMPYILNAHAELIDVFKDNGPAGLTTEDTARFFRFWEANRPAELEDLMPMAIQKVDGLHERLESGIKVVDIGTSRGHLCNWLATRYPSTTITGLDIASEMISEAKATARQRGLTNVSYEVGDASYLPSDWTEKFDLLIMNDVLHDVPLASKAVAEVHRVLKKGGVYMVIDIYAHANPRDNIGDEWVPRLLVFSLYYCLPSSMSVKDSEAHGNCSGIETYKSLLEKAGFDMKAGGMIEKLGSYNVLIVCRK